MSNKRVIKTADGYFSVYGWDFVTDMNKACALPFPNGLNITLSTAIKWLKDANKIYSIEPMEEPS